MTLKILTAYESYDGRAFVSKKALKGVGKPGAWVSIRTSRGESVIRQLATQPKGLKNADDYDAAEFDAGIILPRVDFLYLCITRESDLLVEVQPSELDFDFPAQN